MTDWAFGGVSLDQMGVRGVLDVSGAIGLPTPRGDNPEIPQRFGRVHVEKFAEQRHLALGMFVAGDSLADLESNLGELKALFGSRRQQVLQRTLADSTIRQAMAEVINDLQVRKVGPLAARMVVDFLLADPFFYLADGSTHSVTVNVSPKSNTLTSEGTADNWKAQITLTGPLNTPQILNQSTGRYIKFNASIAGGHSVVLDCEHFTAVKDGTDNAIASVAHDGGALWWIIHPGDNSLVITSATTGGSVAFAWHEAFL